MKVEFSLGGVCPSSGLLKDACGLPFGCVVQPLAPPADGLPLFAAAGPAPVSRVARCRHCYAYINALCELTGGGFVCSVCGQTTDISANAPLRQRYLRQALAREILPELACSVYEADCGGDDDDSAGSASAAAAGGRNGGSGAGVATTAAGAPAYLALVDTAGDDEFLDLVRASLLSALDALPRGALFGLITFSDRIGLWDVRGPAPHVRCLPVIEGLAPAAALEDALPLASLLAPVGQYRDRMAQALELVFSEAPVPHPSTPQPPPGMDRGGPGWGRDAGGRRALGPALQAVIEYASGIGTPGCAPVLGQLHLLTLLSGPSDLGPGRTLSDTGDASLPSSRSSSASSGRPGSRMADAEEAESRTFYEQAAAAAAGVGVCVDLFAVSSTTVGLQLLEPLCSATGGAMYLYPSADSASLPQDLARRVSSGRAFGGLLRLRASRPIRAARCYGAAFADKTTEGLHHVPGADAGAALAFDFEHMKGVTVESTSREAARPVVVQIAFQYSRVVPLGPGAGSSSTSLTAAAGGGGGGSGTRFELQRRLRVATFSLEPAHSCDAVYSAAAPDACLALLAHKVCRAVRLQGVPTARRQLRDWLVGLAARYHRNTYPRASEAQLIDLPVDVTFTRHPGLAPLPRAVYALLRSPLLAPAAQAHADLTAYLHHLWCALPAVELSRAVYPELSAWADPGTRLATGLDLSKATMDSFGAPGSGGAAEGGAPAIWVLDAFILILVLRRAEVAGGGGGEQQQPWAPPQDSLLWQTINKTRQARRVSPHVEVVEDGGDGEALFESLLIDDPDPEDSGDEEGAPPGGGGGGGGGQQAAALGGRAGFEQHVRAEVALTLRPDH